MYGPRHALVYPEPSTQATEETWGLLSANLRDYVRWGQVGPWPTTSDEKIRAPALFPLLSTLPHPLFLTQTHY